MSRSEPDPSTLRAALSDARTEQLARRARAAVVGRDLLDGGPLPAYSMASTGRVGPVTGHAAPAEPPAGAAEPELADPEGDTAVSIGLVQRAQSGDADAFGELYDR
ncbi:MAG: hypothetical protein JWN31_1722, partial [Frankiales bacterium]|nr:hypothetical protein [Frankiales bacterium]